MIERGTKERKSKVKAAVVKNTRASTLVPVIKESVEPGSTIYTDALPSYNSLKSDYVHAAIDHAQAFVNGAIHTNGAENFWSLLKRAIKGTYVSVDAAHLGRYVDEEVFRFNERGTDDAGRFAMVMPGTVGKRLTYKALVGHNDAEHLSSGAGVEISGSPN
jgi:transposase-like protein